MKQFLLAFGLSILLYTIGSPFILSVVSIPSIVLWGIALIPVWWVSYKEIKKFANNQLKKSLYSIEQQIEKNDFFIHKKWPLNIDVKRADIGRLAERATKYIQKVDYALAKCRPHAKSWREHPWILDKSLQISRLNMMVQLEAQKKIIQSQLTQLVESVPKQIEALILQIKPDFRNPVDFVPELEAGKLEKLTDFVNQYGSEQTKKTFTQNTNLINLFVQSLDLKDLKHAKFISKKAKSSAVGAPWGEYTRLEAQFRGWHHLINGWMVKGEKKDALVYILSLLEGKLSLSPEALEKNLQILEHDALDTLVRSHLFLLLDRSVDLKLLKMSDRQKIEGWYESHKVDILKAQACMEGIFKDPAKPIPQLQELAQYFYLLDSAILISSIQSEHVFHNLIRNYFEQYEGSHPWAHLFLRFVPEESSERIEYTQKAQTKRLEWFIGKAQSEGLKPDIIHQEEVSLFNDRHIDPKIAANPCEFIGKKIQNHPLYVAPYSPAFQNFLDIFCQHAFCNTAVKTEYLKNHKIGGSIA